uniref:Endo/exonuclease/phosphatase domain-containing protein n=1 Tax=Macrostomum lignano TaxID=282301 RepID=A0A1I8JPX9_9PLAT
YRVVAARSRRGRTLVFAAPAKDTVRPGWHRLLTFLLPLSPTDMQQRTAIEKLGIEFSANPDSVLLATDVARSRLDIRLSGATWWQLSGSRGLPPRAIAREGAEGVELYRTGAAEPLRPSRSGTAVAPGVGLRRARPLPCADCCATRLRSDGDVDDAGESDNLAAMSRAAQPRAAGPRLQAGRDGRVTSIESREHRLLRQHAKPAVVANGQPQELEPRDPTWCPNWSIAGPTTKALNYSACAPADLQRLAVCAVRSLRYPMLCPAITRPSRGTPATPQCPTSQGEDAAQAGPQRRSRQQILAAVEQHCSNIPVQPARCLVSSGQLIAIRLIWRSSAYSTEILAQAAHRAEAGSHFDRVEPWGVTQLGAEALTPPSGAGSRSSSALQSETWLLISSPTKTAWNSRRPSGAGLSSLCSAPTKTAEPPATDNSDGGATKALITALKERVPANSPLLLCGDFNGESFEPFYNPEEPPFTTFKYVGKSAEPQARAIDYIWYRAPATASPAGDSASGQRRVQRSALRCVPV